MKLQIQMILQVNLKLKGILAEFNNHKSFDSINDQFYSLLINYFYLFNYFKEIIFRLFSFITFENKDFTF